MFRIEQDGEAYLISYNDKSIVSLTPTGSNRTALKMLMCDIAIMIGGSNAEALMVVKQIKDFIRNRALFSITLSPFYFEQGGVFNMKVMKHYKKLAMSVKSQEDLYEQERMRHLQSVLNNSSYGASSSHRYTQEEEHSKSQEALVDFLFDMSLGDRVHKEVLADSKQIEDK